MQKIKIFLASSDELREEREKFGDFINGLRHAFEPQGIDLELVKWEYLNSAYRGRVKEKEYLDEVKNCQLFVALFHTKAGRYTRQELEEARRSLDAYKLPSILIFMKDLEDGETQTPELEELKDKILNDNQWKHFNDTYNHIDTLKLRFLQQFIINLKNSSLRLEVEDSMVRFNNTDVACLDNMSFATNNARYQELKQKIAEANKNIEGLEQILAQGENSFLQQMVNSQKKVRAELRNELEQVEKDLLASSQRIAALKAEAMDQRTRRVIDLFESGDNKGADELLNFNDIQRDINWISSDIQRARINAKTIISQLMFKAQNLLILYDKPNRFEEAEKSYDLAVECAAQTRLEEVYLVDLYDRYLNFLNEHARYEKALTISEQWIRTSIFAFGQENVRTAIAFNNTGMVYNRLGQFSKALEHYLKALEIRQKIFGREHVSTAATFNNIAEVYNSLGRYSEALENYVDALMIYEKVFPEHQTIATIYNNIGGVYNNLGEYTNALNYYMDALSIYKKTFGEEHPTTATAYNNIGFVYNKLSNTELALQFYDIALTIRKKVIGEINPATASTYSNIGYVYLNLGEYEKAVENFERALDIQLRIVGHDHPTIAISYNNLGKAHNGLGNYDKAVDYFHKALTIKEKVYKEDHPSIAITANNLGVVYNNLQEYDKARTYLEMALAIREKNLGKEHPATASTYNNLGKLYSDIADYQKALDFLNKALKIWEKVFGKVHAETASAYKNLGDTYHKQGMYDKALENYTLALNAQEQLLSDNNPETIKTLWAIARTYQKTGDISQARQYIQRLAQQGDQEALKWLDNHPE